MLELRFRRRSVEASRHPRESVLIRRLSPRQHGPNGRAKGLSHPHSGKVTVPRTGTLPPPSYGKGPTAVGERVMGLPGSPRNPAPHQDQNPRANAQPKSRFEHRHDEKLTRKGSERESWERAARVVRSWENQLRGERRQSRELREYSECEGAVRLEGLQEHVRRAAQHTVSAKTALEGKPDALKRARPVWEGAR
jgi:hypothetical protein